MSFTDKYQELKSLVHESEVQSRVAQQHRDDKAAVISKDYASLLEKLNGLKEYADGAVATVIPTTMPIAELDLTNPDVVKKFLKCLADVKTACETDMDKIKASVT